MVANPIQELDERITQVALRIITFAIYLAIVENLVTRAPLSLILSNSAVVIMLTALATTHKKWRTNKLIIKWLFIVFCFVILPLVWFTSKGAFGAQPVYMAAFIILCALVLDQVWATILSVATMCIVALLMLLEHFNLIVFMEVDLPQELIFSNLIHYIIVYIMLLGIGITFKKNYISFQEEHYRLSVFDDLTRLNNRRYLIESISQLVSETRRHHESFSVLFIDIDHFKLVNDIEGHMVGDEVLIMLGKLINDGLREYDIAGRYGGDEFMILLPHTKVEDASVIAKRISTNFNQSIKAITEQPISLSIGVVASDDKTSEEIIKAADKAMYSKKKG
ncbi:MULTISPECIES: GGDEF domain-containing protein [unclassified Fusibacter]|uniref:GGDEF domain-containing protein n=1 Tax=unclassified Fusibacter TaxID=2624464 RepID=UPI00101012ED|nr:MULTISPECIES: GGDEF domain-containing protein [unclassified Fusibacter]MCK8058427.1 GGDEF domain-containing protein [Fusibacter sp. A2]NPE22805.1 GGDEF domain-containing protein [Fusibacter sp. A1]RXV60360.1 GGDEF domain-containing protein [Fusibacter sp. A1]